MSYFLCHSQYRAAERENGFQLNLILCIFIENFERKLSFNFYIRLKSADTKPETEKEKARKR